MIRHILKDGTEVKDITGHIVCIEDAQKAYAVLDKVKGEKERQDEV